ncbi:hypothetical protein IEN85_10770 [Pelagicoccus sp. NFK12]|uniref:Uncharacterized protein n=1 Tax=Pelagicoccus enzymogenes TaxID=2773457 RepID=A0A927IHA0_9BACT|nr:hypothetical protein [Pelagicoccus enzymogenes]MBD5779971.1 hypothetical protein [Pelagicoccus enzymogenes]
MKKQKPFADGIIFGFGMSISLSISLFVLAFFVFPEVTERVLMQAEPPAYHIFEERYGHETFTNLSFERMFKQSSVVLLAEPEPNKTENQKVRISEILKKNPNTNFSLSEGDEYDRSHSKFITSADCDGALVFYVGNPPRQKASFYYTDGIIGYRDKIPLHQIKQFAKN